LTEALGRTVLYPTWRGVGAMAAGAPVSVLAALMLGAGWWRVALIWIVLVILALGLDALLAPSRRHRAATVVLPPRLEAGGSAGEAAFSFPRARVGAVELALDADALLDVRPASLTTSTAAGARFVLQPRRRGRARLRALHLRWRGPLGLVWIGGEQALGCTLDITPNISAVREEAMRLFSRNRDGGTAVQRDLSASLEFHALREFRGGDDTRTINWKQSARHRTLMVRETRAERNRTIVMAIDTGRLMSEPLDGGLPRIDYAVNAALLLGYVGLKLGDRVGLFAFADRPRLDLPAHLGTGSFAALQEGAAGLDYSTEETNFALGLSTLAACLPGRALVVIFTDFADATGAALMVDHLSTLLARHVVIFVAFRDSELEGLARAAPDQPADVSRAVVAGGLLRERDLVLRQLARLSVDVLEAPGAASGPVLLRRYLALKREDRI
jgi:uncharacterized protein (DUF58 family)